MGKWTDSYGHVGVRTKSINMIIRLSKNLIERTIRIK